MLRTYNKQTKRTGVLRAYNKQTGVLRTYNKQTKKRSFSFIDALRTYNKQTKKQVTKRRQNITTFVPSNFRSEHNNFRQL